jgi:hypothetical protein
MVETLHKKSLTALHQSISADASQYSKFTFSKNSNFSVLRERPFNLKGGLWFFLKKYSDFGGGKKNNLIQSFCHKS